MLIYIHTVMVNHAVLQWTRSMKAAMVELISRDFKCC